LPYIVAMAGASRFKFLAIAMVFHLVYIYSIFDIYFVSPVVSGMQLFQLDRPSGQKAPADRLVLFVGMNWTHPLCFRGEIAQLTIED
jgi:hypothetical protein